MFFKLIYTLGVAFLTHQRWLLGDEAKQAKLHRGVRSAPLPSNPPPFGGLFLSLNLEGGQLNPPPPPGRAAFQPPAWYALKVRWNP